MKTKEYIIFHPEMDETKVGVIEVTKPLTEYLMVTPEIFNDGAQAEHYGELYADHHGLSWEPNNKNIGTLPEPEEYFYNED